MSTEEMKLPAPEIPEDTEEEIEPIQMTEVLREILVDLHQSTTDITLSMVASRDGLAMIAHGDMDSEDHAAAICAELTALCQQAADDFRIGAVNMQLARGSEGCMILLRVNDDVVLALAAHSGANIGFLLLEGERAAEAIASAL